MGVSGQVLGVGGVWAAFGFAAARGRRVAGFAAVFDVLVGVALVVADDAAALVFGVFFAGLAEGFAAAGAALTGAAVSAFTGSGLGAGASLAGADLTGATLGATVSALGCAGAALLTGVFFAGSGFTAATALTTGAASAGLAAGLAGAFVTFAAAGFFGAAFAAGFGVAFAAGFGAGFSGVFATGAETARNGAIIAFCEACATSKAACAWRIWKSITDSVARVILAANFN